ncbi:histidine kinase [Chloroflexota bacterium]
MQKAKSAKLIDWIIITLRWVFLFGVSLGLAFGSGFTWPVLLLLVVGGVVNLIFTIIAMGSSRIPGQDFIGLFSDMLLSYLLFYLTWPEMEWLAWMGLLPLLTAALYFGWVGALVLVFLNLLVQGWITWLVTPVQDTLPSDLVFLLALLTPLYLLVGVGAAYSGHRWGSGVKRSAGAVGDTADRERRRTIYELISTLSSSLNYERTLDTALNLSTNTLAELDAPVEDLVGIVMFFASESSGPAALEVVASRLLLPGDTHLTLSGTSGLIGYCIDEGQPNLSKKIQSDPEISRFVSLRSYHSAYCIPLRSGLDAYGVMIFAHPDADFFSHDRSEVLDIIGKQFVISIQNARLYLDLEQEKERMMGIQEDSRRKLARDLHDGPTQSIAAIAMRVNFARRMMERDLKTASEELYKIEDLARRTTKEIRLMLFTLRPLVLESQGLLPALESMADKMKDTYSQNVIVQSDTKVGDVLEPAKQAVVFYIAEEAVNNARKHAQAEHIWVRLKIIRKGLSLLEIEDNGVGFDVSEVDNAYEDRGSLGMVNMRERTELVNGLLHIDSVVGRGTKIQVAIPLTKEATELLQRGT